MAQAPPLRVSPDKESSGADRRDGLLRAPYSLAYDAPRKSATALLNHQGLRPPRPVGTSPSLIPSASNSRASRAQRLSIGCASAATQAEYPDPRGYDPITQQEANDAIKVAGDCVMSAERLLALDELGV